MESIVEMSARLPEQGDGCIFVSDYTKRMVCKNGGIVIKHYCGLTMEPNTELCCSDVCPLYNGSKIEITIRPMKQKFHVTKLITKGLNIEIPEIRVRSREA